MGDELAALARALVGALAAHPAELGLHLQVGRGRYPSGRARARSGPCECGARRGADGTGARRQAVSALGNLAWNNGANKQMAAMPALSTVLSPPPPPPPPPAPPPRPRRGGERGGGADPAPLPAGERMPVRGQEPREKKST